MTTSEDVFREALTSALKIVGEFVKADDSFNKAKQDKLSSEDSPELRSLKLAVMYEAVNIEAFYGKITDEGCWKLLQSAFFDWERDALSREVYLWDNVWAGRDARCKAMLAMKVLFGEKRP